jgi:hypothetical protein
MARGANPQCLKRDLRPRNDSEGMLARQKVRVGARQPLVAKALQIGGFCRCKSSDGRGLIERQIAPDPGRAGRVALHRPSGGQLIDQPYAEAPGAPGIRAEKPRLEG